jgi:cytochrome c oxidase subunit II
MMAFFDIKKLLGLPVLASEHGQDVDKFIIYVHWLMAVLFVGWLSYFIYALVRFRQSRQPKADYVGVKGHASNYLEIAVALIEAVLLIGFAIPLWAKVVDEYPDPKDSTVIRVTAEQFQWNSRYPGKDGVFGAQDRKFVDPGNKFGYDPNDPAGKDDVVPPFRDIRVPVGKPVLIYLTSLDVIHSLDIHPLRVCQDAIPGMRIPVHFTPTKVGKYKITCAQLCGNGHYGMYGDFTVETPEDYQKWLDANANSGAAAGGFE